jgi:hypothetical protein
MPSGKKYIRHEEALSEAKMRFPNASFVGSYKEYRERFGKDQRFKNTDIVVLDPEPRGIELKVHRHDTDWGEVGLSQALRLLNGESIWICEYQQDDTPCFSDLKDGRSFVEQYCYFTDQARIHYNHTRANKRVASHPVTENKIKRLRTILGEGA